MKIVVIDFSVSFENMIIKNCAIDVKPSNIDIKQKYLIQNLFDSIDKVKSWRKRSYRRKTILIEEKRGLKDIKRFGKLRK